ncbi:MAG: Bug family tripartite tricarboxylate transporter substrate binding protein [Lautropia sp.]
MLTRSTVKRRRSLGLALRLALTLPVALGAATFAAHATAQDGAAGYPNRTVRLVIPYATGAHADLLARTVAQKLSEAWQQQVVVENRPGGGGTIGTSLGAHATPDGYTLLMSALGQLVIYPSMQTNPPYNVLTDFAPVVPLVRTPWVLYTNKEVPAKDARGLLDYARSRPGGLNGATPGIGTTNHLANALLVKATGIQAESVHYPGSAQAIQDLIANRTQFMFDSLLSLRFVADGKLNALAVTGAKRSPYAPELPTMIESGVPDFDVSVWFGLFFPPKTPPAIVDKVNADVRRLMAMKDTQDRLSVAKFEYIHDATPVQFSEMIRQDHARWSKVVKDLGLKVQ